MADISGWCPVLGAIPFSNRHPVFEPSLNRIWGVRRWWAKIGHQATASADVVARIWQPSPVCGHLRVCPGRVGQDSSKLDPGT